MNASRAALLGIALGLPASALSADWVGPQTCAACHPKAYESWSAGPHAHAASSLTEAERRQPACLHCHAPELSLAPAEADRPANSAGGAEVWQRPPLQAQRDGITCEACHGAGEYYASDYVMRDAELARAVGLRDPGAGSCLGCHLPDAPSLSPFDFKAKVQLIDHWTQEKAARHPAAQGGDQRYSTDVRGSVDEPDRGRGGPGGVAPSRLKGDNPPGGPQPTGPGPHGSPAPKEACR